VDLMEQCWCQNPALRPDFVEICATLESIHSANEDIDSR